MVKDIARFSYSQFLNTAMEVDCQLEPDIIFSRSDLNYVHLNIFNDTSPKPGRKKPFSVSL